MNCAVGRDAGDSQTGALLPRHTLGQASDLLDRNDRKLGRRAKRAIGLSSVAPHRLPQPLGRNTGTDLIHLSCAITMRNDTRIGHSVTKGVLTLLDIAWVEARGRHPQAHFSRTGMRVRRLTYDQDVPNGPLLLIPGCFHSIASPTLYGWIFVAEPFSLSRDKFPITAA